MRKLLLLTFVVVIGAVGRTAPAETSPASLSEFFKPGVVLQDRNGDNAIDFVDARIVLVPQPTSVELAAAANVAARLGFETSAMDLPFVRVDEGGQASETGATIFVGARSLARADVTAASIGGPSLKAGEGLVAAFTLSGKPAVAAIGGDDNGLTAAALMLAGHLPYVWDQKGPTADKIAEDVKQFLAGKGVQVSSAVATAIQVRAGSIGAERVVVALQMANGGEVIKGQVALNQFKATSARDATRPMSYSNLRAVQVRMRAPGMGVITVDLPGAAAPDAAALPPGRRPAGGANAKENFDLSTFYTIEGALSDSDNNLIPDRVDVLLSADGDGGDGVVDLAARLGLESTGVSLPMAKPPNAASHTVAIPIVSMLLRFIAVPPVCIQSLRFAYFYCCACHV